MFRTKVTISLLEVILGLLQPLHPVLDLQIDLRLKKWSQMIPQNQVSSMLRTKVTISLLEVVHGFLLPLHHVLDLQIDLRLTKMVPNDPPYPKNLGLVTKTKCLASPEANFI